MIEAAGEREWRGEGRGGGVTMCTQGAKSNTLHSPVSWNIPPLVSSGGERQEQEELLETKPPIGEAPYPPHDYLHAAAVNTGIISRHNRFIDYPSILREEKQTVVWIFE